MIREGRGSISEIIVEKTVKIKDYKGGVTSSLVPALPLGCRLNLTKFQATTNRSRRFSVSLNTLTKRHSVKFTSLNLILINLTF